LKNKDWRRNRVELLQLPFTPANKKTEKEQEEEIK
jgi:hypothetical protein